MYLASTIDSCDTSVLSTSEPSMPATESALAALPECDLIRRCSAGDIAAFRELYERHKTGLYSLAYRFHGNRFDAEDSLQEAFIAIYRNIGGFQGQSRFSTWVYRIVINACISAKRGRHRHEEPSDAIQADALPVRQDDGDPLLSQLLEREISALPRLHRMVFLLHTMEQSTHEEIAQLLDIRPGTSKSCYHRARKTLRKRLLKHGIDRYEV
jgi:RNA polymerase sigma-70 factor (ECF subfamily)